MDYFPFFRRYPYYYMPQNFTQNRYEEQKNYTYNYENNNIKENEEKNRKNEEEEKRNILEENKNSQKILGLNLDDVLIIVILLFLYSEGVKDKMLFIILIMLLLS